MQGICRKIYFHQCVNGQPTKADSCYELDVEECAACDAGYFLNDNLVCEVCRNKCNNGLGTISSTCDDGNLTYSCQECQEGYILSYDNQCIIETDRCLDVLEISAEIDGFLDDTGGAKCDSLGCVGVTLWWDNNVLTNELDLYVVGPEGTIYYHNKRIGEGALDVEHRGHGRPIENIVWARQAPGGNYRVIQGW